ncbi:MAG: hypothetical protein NTU98_04455 [Bacteroidetes bacterium]|nr:hypothetical protein [Bacteroidota bacterium]
MNRYFTLLAAIVISVASMAQNADYLSKQDFQAEKKKISEGIDAAKKNGFEAKKLVTKQVAIIDSLTKLIAANEKMVAVTNDSLRKTISEIDNLEAKFEKKASTSQHSLFLSVIIVAILYLVLFVLVIYFRTKWAAKMREVSEENQKLSDALKQEAILLKEHFDKKAQSLSLEFHEHAANLSAKEERTEERQRQLALELEDLMDNIVKDHDLQKTIYETMVSENKSAHEKLETELKNLKSQHTKDIQDIKSKH